MKQTLIRVFSLIAVLVLLALAIFLSERGFQQVLEFRQLERIPMSGIGESVGGESQLRGKTAAGEKLLKAPRSGEMSIYYRYLLEKKERDSDGNTKWRTVRDDTGATDFYLSDSTGRALVRAQVDAWRLTFSTRQKYRRQEAGYRHTEWRIDPGDDVVVFGWLKYQPDAVVDFSSEGQYQPIISAFSGSAERSRLALGAIFWLWGGVSFVLLASFALTYGLRIHKTLVFLVVVSLSGGLMLFHYGYRSVNADVSGGFDRAVSVWHRANDLVEARLVDRGLLPIGLESPFDLESLAYSELSDVDKRQIDAWRLAAEQVRLRYLQQISQTPDNLVALLRGKNEPPLVALPAAMRVEADARHAAYESTRLASPGLTVWLALGLVAMTAVLAWFSMRIIRTKRMQENIPTSKSAGLVYGLAEVKGRLVAEAEDETLKGPVSGEPCTWYHYVVKEKRGSGKNRKWVVIEDTVRKQPFYCEDDEGRTRIFPGQAECISKHIETKTSGARLYTERRFSPGDELYVLGKVKPDKTRGDALVFSHEKGSPYIIANIAEGEVMFQKATRAIALLSVALSALFLGALLVSGGSGELSSLDFLLAGMIAPVFMLFVVLVLMYNDLIFLRQRCDRNWANIQVSLKKRADLVPQLEEVVTRYLAHERELQNLLVQLREKRQTVTTAGDLDDYLALEHETINRIRVQVESYPDLKGLDLVSVFNRRLITLENEIALIRAGFNDAVMHYQMRRQTFPDNVLAKMFRFEARTALQYTEQAHRIPRVDLTQE